MINFEPLIPAALWIALAISATAALAWHAWRRPPALSPRRWATVIALAAAGLAALLLMLLNPIWFEPVPPPAGKPLVTVLIDRSASMAVGDQPQGVTRFQAAADLATPLAQDLAGEFDVQLRTFAVTTTSVGPGQLAAAKPDGQSTDLATALSESLEGDRPAGQAIILLSDGIHNAPGGVSAVVSAAQTAKAMAAPILTFSLGGSAGLKDLELTLGRQQELAFVGQRVPVRARLKQRGFVVGETTVALWHEGREVAREKVQIAADGAADVTFQVSQAKTGLYRYEAKVEPDSAEAAEANNASTFVLRVVDQPIRVLLLEGKPYWDAKFLMKTLAQDASLELDAVVRVSEGRFVHRALRLSKSAAGTADEPPPGEPGPKIVESRRAESSEILNALPPALESSDKLAEYQVLVLGRDAEVFLTELVVERLRTWISRDGGSLVCYRGAPVATVNQQLARLMPVRWSPTAESRFRMQFTERGQDLNWIAAGSTPDANLLARLPSLASSARPERPTPLAVVLASGQGAGQPVVTYQPYGTGRVVTVEGAGMWRWAFLAPEFRQDEPVYDSLWQGLMRWLAAGAGLAPGQTAVLRTEQVTFFTGEPAAATLLMRSDAVAAGVPDLDLQRADGVSVGTFRPVAVGDEPGVYRVAFGALPEGQYRASLAAGGAEEAGVAFDVRPNYTEQLDVAARPDLLARVAAESGGALLEELRSADVARRFREHLAHSRPPQIREITIWDRLWVLMAVVCCWSLAWGIRRSRGLV